ncbi:hypothetical protein [Hyphomonas chukchiensis]|uniref:Uncharacterized protein n=1 Tax=Hyphomonas chukchiensis TaxID=1280947 RepID=A0A062UDF9_9PROT|nr:hypothetical protein [Hyphomonas chukchiensis]KCZ59383.1 hypothetical protein HY30_14765 [Hyphomonas chukchiensis]
MFYPQIPSRQTETLRRGLPNSPIAAEQVEIVRLLTDPETFGGHAPAYFDTAVSHLFVNGSHLYVLRKPIDDDGFRCATVNERWDWCETQCMRGVSGFGVVAARPLPIVRREGRLCLGGPGSIRDWVLKITCESVTVDPGFITLRRAA